MEQGIALCWEQDMMEASWLWTNWFLTKHNGTQSKECLPSASKVTSYTEIRDEDVLGLDVVG